MLVMSHESVGVVAFCLWAAFELHLEQPFAEIEIVGVARSVAVQQPQPCRPCTKREPAGDPGEFVNFLPVKGLSA